MEIRFYSGFKKRLNSTKQPTTASLTLTGSLKEACSIENPVISIEMATSPAQYVYAYIPDFGRYYFVNDWVSNLGVWECHLTEDYLASWKTDIGNSYAYIERSASLSDGTITDNTYPATTDFDITSVAMASAYYGVAPSGGCYVLGVINNMNFATPQDGGAVTYYALSPSKMRSLMHYLLSDSFLDDNGFPATQSITQQLSQSTAKAFVNPVQLISSCIWLPFAETDLGNVQANIVLGYYDLDNNVLPMVTKVTEFSITTRVTGTVPQHPQAATRGAYLNYAPYTRLSVSIPPFGNIPIDTSFLKYGNYLVGDINIDTLSGLSNMRISLQPDAAHIDNTRGIITEVNALFGIPIQIAQLTANYFGVASNIMQAAAGALSGSPSLVLDSIGNAINNAMPQARVQGNTGSFTQCVIPPVLTAHFFKITEEDNTELGRPLCKVKKINTLSGYIKCGEASIDLACFDSEKQEILNHLLSGFFYE